MSEYHVKFWLIKSKLAYDIKAKRIQGMKRIQGKTCERIQGNFSVSVVLFMHEKEYKVESKSHTN